MRDQHLVAALGALEIAFPETPSITTGVIRRLREERATGVRTPVPGSALWSRRRVLVLVAVGVLAALAIAAAARYAIGAFEVRVQPGVTPGPSTPPPFAPDVLGDPVSPDVAIALAGFEAELPEGPTPDAIYVVDSPFGDRALAFAWSPSATYPQIEGTDWGLLLVAAQGEAEFVTKTLDRFEDMTEVEVDGGRAFWIPVPHELLLETERGTETFNVGGKVLIWQAEDGLSYRLETALRRADAIALAESFR